MGKLIKVEDAMLCCRGNSVQLIKDARANFQAIAAEFLAEAGRVNQASGGAIAAGAARSVVWVVRSLAEVVLTEQAKAAIATSLGLGVGATGSLLQQMEWLPPELQVQAAPVNLEGGLTIGQASTLFEQAAQEALARHAQRVRGCTVDRSLPQTSKAVWIRGSIRTRKRNKLRALSTQLLRLLPEKVKRFFIRP